MPGPVSDSYDPEFGTGEACDEVRMAAKRIRARVSKLIGCNYLLNIVGIARGYNTDTAPLPKLERRPVELSEWELRLIRFCINRALETL